MTGGQGSGVGFADRAAAGTALAGAVSRHLAHTDLRARPLVLAVGRGGVPVAAPVADAIGAIAEDGPPAFDPAALYRLGLTEDDLTGEVRRQREELRRRIRRYRGDRPSPRAENRVVVLVDDGLGHRRDRPRRTALAPRTPARAGRPRRAGLLREARDQIDGPDAATPAPWFERSRRPMSCRGHITGGVSR
jgi:hypothetical protein